MQIATWNVNSLKVRLPQLLDWLAASAPDVLALQEIKMQNEQFPHAALQEAGYAHCAVHGQKTYNGVALISRWPLQDVVCAIPDLDDPQARVIAATVRGPQGPLRVVNAYFVNGQAPDSDKFTYKMQWLTALHGYVRAELAQHARLVLLGDFNIAPEDADSHDPEGLRETIHHTSAERAHFQALLALGLHDAYRLFAQAPQSFSWWDYRMLGFQKNRGLRIDHILISDALRPIASACHIDRAPRKNKQPSDHTPVVLTLGGGL